MSKKIIPTLTIGDIVEVTLVNLDMSPAEVFIGEVVGVNETPDNRYGRAVSVETTHKFLFFKFSGKSFCVQEERITKHIPSKFNEYMRMPRAQQNKFLKAHGYEWHYYDADFADDNDDFGGGDEWILYDPNGNAIEPVAAYRRILG